MQTSTTTISVKHIAALGAALLIACLWLQYDAGFFFWGRYGFAFGNDDAFISYRYAKNLVDAGILSFNVTDQPLVEGFSNPLYVLLAAIVYAVVGMDRLYPAMAVIGGLFAVGAYLLMLRAAARRLGIWAAAALALALALCPPVWIHSVDGLETPLALLLQVIIWLAVRTSVERSNSYSLAVLMVASALSVTCRIDGFVFPVIAASWLLLARRRRDGVAVLAVVILTFLAVLVARQAYYGELWPNTYYAKINGSLTERFRVAGALFGSILYKNGLWVALLAALAAAASHVRLGIRTPATWLPPFELWAFFGLLAYYFLIGGDIYRERFLVLLFPLGLWAGLELLHRRRYAARWSVFFAVVAAVAQLAAFTVDPRLAWHFQPGEKWDRWVFLGKFLAENYPTARLATSSAGKLPYYSGLETIDVLGLNDKHIARTPSKSASPGHGRFDTAYVLGKRPDIIAMYAYGDGDLVFGMPRSNYEPAGYRLTYLVKNEDMPGGPIVSVVGLDKAGVAKLIRQGYNYGVVLRQ
jgi:hypothetical protein